jgi:hypothetical protein
MKVPERVYSTPEHCELAMEFAEYQSDAEDRIELLKKLNNSQIKLIKALNDKISDLESQLKNLLGRGLLILWTLIM